MRTSIRSAFIIALAVAIARLASAQPVSVDLELILAVDCSRSIDDDEFALQIEGYAYALRHPSILRAIESGERRAIAVTYVQWAGPFLQKQSLDWTLIKDGQSADTFAANMQAAPRSFRGGGTSLSGVIDFSRALFKGDRFVGRRRVIDISGDGINNSGRMPHLARDDAVREGIVINGLPILTEVSALDRYFRDHVIGGEGSFVVEAEDFASFAQAILNKLIREIANVPAEIATQLARGAPDEH